MTPIITVDVGNTSAKVAVYNPKSRKTVASQPVGDTSDIIRLCKHFGAKLVMVSSVSATGDRLTHELADYSAHKTVNSRSETIEVRSVSGSMPLPFTLGYTTPATLGPDRICAVAGGVAEFGTASFLVIDIGTAITLDLHDSRHGFVGGNISPGVGTRFRALHALTGKLPLIDSEAADTKNFCNSDIFGNDTKSAILNGVLTSVWAEIQWYTQRMEERYADDFRIIFTGGGVKHFEIPQKKYNFVRPNLVFSGLGWLGANHFGKHIA